PSAAAATHRVFFAKQLIHETNMSMAEIGLASGFGDIRRFNAAFRKVFGKSPSNFRKRSSPAKEAAARAFQCALTLPFRPPFDWPGILSFFRHRVIPGVERVTDDAYHRTVRLNETRGWISVERADAKNALRLTARLTDSRDLMALVARVRRMFDLDADMFGVARVFRSDPILSGIWKKHEGTRLPGSWDPFEMAVRAVAGQQITVKAACTLAGRIARLAGEKARGATSLSLTHYFPTARELSRADPSKIGMPEKRKQTLWGLAKAAADGEIRLRVTGALDDFIREFTQLPGIGEWTANYIAMRGLGEPDAFPAGDLGIVKALTEGDVRPTRAAILRRAESWRPWRAYAAICLWRSL
ncbi:MAG: DNA-3-methyladenine glycosylase 2, partial [Desulfobacterales bacterium]|nr:DNA-3-methyladenine glycosylase 2 [Desulfobacterales bacterium]